MKFQDKFKKAYYQSDLDWDKNAMWNSIENELPPKKKKKRFLFFFIGLALLFVLSMFFVNDFAVNNELNESVSSTDRTEDGDQIVSGHLNKSKTNEKEDRQEIFILNDNDTINEHKQSESHSGENNEFELKELIENNSQYDSKFSSRNITNNHLVKNFHESGGLKNGLFYSGDDSTFKNESRRSHFQIYIPKISTTRDQYIKFESILDLPKLDIERIETIKPNEVNDFLLSFKTFAGVTNQHVSSSEESNKAFVALHGSSKNLQESLGGELILNKRIRKHFMVGLGLAYFTSFEWYNGESTTLDKGLVMSDTSSFFVVNGLKNYVGGESIQTTSTTTKFKSPVRRQYIDIPIVFAFEIKLFKIQFQTFAKYNFNIMHRLSGRTYSKDLNLLESSKTEIQNMYKSNNVHSYSYGFDALYPISKTIAGSFGLVYRKQLNSSFNASIGVDEIYSSCGISLGLSYKL